MTDYFKRMMINPNIGDKVKSMSPMTIIVIVLGLVAVGVGLYFFYQYLTTKYKTSYHAPETKENLSGKTDCEIMLFSATWCPHCRAAKPIWDEVAQTYSDKTVNGRKIIFTDIDCTTETPDVKQKMDQYKIEGFPTIKLVKDGNVIEFDTKVTKENLDKFINTVI
jgi:thiol-disulfide isomerase/thioredoxin